MMPTKTMKALVCTRYGSPDYLKVQDMPKPEAADNEILVRVRATTITKADTMMRRAVPFFSRFMLGLFRPKNPITGTGFAGVVEQVGTQVTNFQVGDAVFGETGITFSANAEYLTVAADGVVLRKPAALTFEEAATMTDGPLTSYNFLKNLGQLEPGHRVLINGASGSLGTAAIQIAKYEGAHVTGVCSTRNVEMVKKLGVDEVIDYTQTDFAKNGQRYDLIYDTVGKLSFQKCKSSLTPRGRYLTPVLQWNALVAMISSARSSGKKAIFSATGLQNPLQLHQFLGELVVLADQGRLRPVMDRTYALSEGPAGHRYVDTGRKRGNVVIAF